MTITEGEAGEVRLDDYVFDPDGDAVTLAGETPSSAQGEAAVSSGNFESFSFTPGARPRSTDGIDHGGGHRRARQPGAHGRAGLRDQSRSNRTSRRPCSPRRSASSSEADCDPLDLVASGAVVDPEEDALAFTLIEGGADGLDGRLASDGKITAKADDAAEGLSATYRYSVTDGPSLTVCRSRARSPCRWSPAPSHWSCSRASRRTDIRQGQAEKVDVLRRRRQPVP